MEDSYHTIAGAAKNEIKVKGSRFIAECHSVTSPDEAMAALEIVRKREHAATHHCSAWRVGLFDDTSFKYSDDGEPSGTAGRPIYDTICGRDLQNTIVVVTRYYGGTKLGTGGLVRAYGDAAAGALDQAGRTTRHLTVRYRVTLDFGLFDQLMSLLNKFEARQIEATYTDQVTQTVEVRLSQRDALRTAIIELSSGKAIIEEA